MGAPIRLSMSERACFFGRTGSGKTTLAKALLSTAPRFVVLDAKHTFRMKGVPITHSFMPFKNRQIVRVPADEWETARWSDVINQVWRKGRTILYIDELTLINTSGTKVLPSLGKAVRTGRERGLGVWIGSQRPKDIPNAVITEAEHFFIFRLTLEADRDKVSRFTSDALWEPMKRVNALRHEYLYYNVLNERLSLQRLDLSGVRQ